ncbi:reverse transcriptase domain-containing protein [Tanacetum coccineum]
MKDFSRPSLIGRGGLIAPTTAPGTDFVLKNHMVRLLQQNCQFHGFRDEDANEHLNKYLSITQFMKQNGVSQDSISLNLFPFSLTHEAESWFYHLKTNSIHTWEEMILKFLSKYYPHSRALLLRKDILNFRQLPMESLFEAWERFKSCLRKCPDHRILLLNQILTFYNGITMIDQERFMVAAGDNFMRKTPQEAYDLIENMTQHHFYVQHQPGPGHPNTVYYSDDSDESDEDEPSQKLIHSLSGNPTPSSDYVVESLSPLPTSFGDTNTLLEETDTLLSHSDDSLPDYETFCFDIEEKSSGSTTTHSDYSLPEYDSFIFDLSINPLPPTDRSDSHHKEFADELAHIVSSREYDYFYFDIEPNLGELTILFEENLSKDSTKELTISFPYRNKDKIFDPGIFIIKGVQSKRFHILPLDNFSNISFVSNSLLLIDPSEIETFLSFPSGNEDKVFDPGILLNNGIFSFTIKSPNLLIDNFMIDKCHILSEISLKIVSSINFHPKDKEIRREST